MPHQGNSTTVTSGPNALETGAYRRSEGGHFTSSPDNSRGAFFCSIHPPSCSTVWLSPGGLLTAPWTTGRPDPFSSLPLLQLISPRSSDWPQIYKHLSDSVHGSFVQLPLQYYHTRPHLGHMTCMTFTLLFLAERVVSDSTLESIQPRGGAVGVLFQS